MLVINTQPARDKMIDILNRVWFDLPLLSVEVWGRVDLFYNVTAADAFVWDLTIARQ